MLHVETNRDHKKQIVVFSLFVMFSFWFFLYSFTYCTAYWLGAQRRHRYEETMQSLSWECAHGSTMKCCGMKPGKVYRIRDYKIGWRGLCIRYAMSITLCHWFQHHIFHFDRLGDDWWEVQRLSGWLSVVLEKERRRHCPTQSRFEGTVFVLVICKNTFA